MSNPWDHPGWKQAAVDYAAERERSRPSAPSAPVRQPRLYTAAELKDQAFMPLRWIVPHYFPEGVTLIAGKPKIGKSWLMLGISLAVSGGKVVLDQTCEQREVIYYALEDSRRRMQDRIGKIMNGNPEWPPNLNLSHQLAPLENGGMDLLQTDFNVHQPGLIIIDTLGRVRGSRKNTENEYQADYRGMSVLHDFGRRNAVALIVVHHLRKQTADDPFDTISGTHGLTGAADTIGILTKADDQLRFLIRGRDCEEQDKIVDFDPDTGIWNVTGNYQGKDPTSTDAQHRILDALEAHHPMSMTPAQIAKELTMPAATVRVAVRRLYQDSKIKRAKYGTYYL